MTGGLLMHDDSPAMIEAPRHVALGQLIPAVFDEPSSGLAAWARTTAGMVACLAALQIVTGTLLAFDYLPSVQSAHTTVAYIEKAAAAGPWIRAMHSYGSILLPAVLALHIIQRFWQRGYERRPFSWTLGVLLLAVVMGSGATGYSLPWDARAFYSTRVAEGIVDGLPGIGSVARQWLLGGSEISQLTLSRFFALHVLVIPAIIGGIAAARVLVVPLIREAREPADTEWWKRQLFRQAIAAGAVFFALALFAAKVRAPFGPPEQSADPGYIARPGGQFRWLFEMLKFAPGRIGSLVAVAFPGIVIGGLAILPYLNRLPFLRGHRDHRRAIGAALLIVGLAPVAVLTPAAYIADARDARTRDQLAHQDAEEKRFLSAPFVPQAISASDNAGAGSNESSAPGSGGASPAGTPAVASGNNPPAAYLKNCASCHGSRGTGTQLFPSLLNVAAKPRRTVDDLVAIMNDPKSYGLRPPMKSFAGKISDDDKRAIAEWVESLGKGQNHQR